jgi:hypothetical protein
MIDNRHIQSAHPLLTTALLVFLVTLGVLAGARDGQAQTKMCIPPPGYVAGLSGAPRWWDGKDQNGVLIPSYDFSDPQWDPRWVGARADGYGGGTTDDARFRAQFNSENGKTYLYLSWFVNVAPTFSPQNTSVYLGLSPVPGNGNANPTATIIQATFVADTGNVANASTDGAQANPATLTAAKWGVSLVQGNASAGFTSPPTPPAWFSDTSDPLSFVNTARAWANPLNNHQWAINFRIPIDPSGTSGVNIGSTSNFKIWYYIQPDLELTGGNIGFIPYTWPRTGADVTAYVVTTGISGTQYPDPNTWSDASLQDPKSEATCLNGVALGDDQIGTTNMPSSAIDPNASNTFFAAPSNYGPGVNPNVIKARFRIANWGSQVGDLTATSWQDIPNLNAVTDTLGIPAGTSSSPTHGNITATLNFTDSTQPNFPAVHDLHCQIVGKSGFDIGGKHVNGDNSCPNATPTLEPHQCILVSLTGNNVDFVRDIAFHNMDFSVVDFAQRADISIKGLPAMGNGRDVFMFLELRNMPGFPTIGSGVPLPSGRPSLSGSGARQPNAFDAAGVIPSYVVHSYYDTGKSVTINGVKHSLYQPLTSFGYFIQHTGLFFGWQPSMEGAAPVRPLTYKVTVPNDSAVKINTTIDVVNLTTWWIWGILIVIILILLIIGWLIALWFRRRPAAV